MNFFRRLNWTNTLFLVLTPIVGIVGTILLVVQGHVAWPTWVLTIVLTAFTGFSITAGYHRLFAHKSYRAAWPIRLLLVLFGAAAFEGSVLEWCTDHRNHHRYTDTEKDPYNIKQGFWHAHIGWLLFLDTKKRDFSNVPDLNADPLLRLQSRYYPLIAMLMGFGLPTAIAALWGNAWAGLLIAGALRITFNHHATFCINSICHLFGKRTYSDRQSARDHWVTALFTYGEGYHNFHHQFPIDYRNGIRAYHFDPTKWLIRGLSFIKLASDLKRVNSHRIIQYKLIMDEKKLLERSSRQPSESLLAQMHNLIKPAKESILNAISRIEELEKAYAELKNKSIRDMQGKVKEYKASLSELKSHLKIARRELKHSLLVWAQLVRCHKPASISA